MGYHRYHREHHEHKRYSRHNEESRSHEVKEDWDSSREKAERPNVIQRIRRNVQKKIEYHKQRNTPERRKERITNMKLEAEEERLKTDIYTSKTKRSQMRAKKISNALGVLSGSSTGGTGRRGKRVSSGMGFGMSAGPKMNWSGMDDMLGMGGRKSKKSSGFF